MFVLLFGIKKHLEIKKNRLIVKQTIELDIPADSKDTNELNRETDSADINEMDTNRVRMSKISG